jgi:tetratricopeptide (TPR) repeat protein
MGYLIILRWQGAHFFYFRDPKYVETIPKEKKADFLSETPVDADKQTELKDLIRKTCIAKNIPLLETYPDPQSLAPIVLEQLKEAIGTQFPIEANPDPLTREARDHEAFAESRRKTYIGQPDYFDALNKHCSDTRKPLVLLGDSGSGKSALLANWVDLWRKTHPTDFVFQHYIGGTPDGSIHWKIMTRLMAEIKRWTDDPEELPKTNDDILRDFPLWLSKARIMAEHGGVRFIVVLDALNQLEDKDYGRLLGWLPEHPFTGSLRLIASSLPGKTMEVIEKRDWSTFKIKPLEIEERRSMIVEYLARFSKKLDEPRLKRLSSESAAANPLYLKILLDELRVTGIHDKLDERLDDYLAAKDIPTLLGKVLARYQRDYEQDRKGLVSEALGLIWAARRGLTEAELLELLRPNNLPQLPLVIWSPFRAALEESLIERGGILNFAHDFLRSAVETAFLPNLDKKDNYRIALADFFESKALTDRNCDELPWLLWQTELFERLRKYLLNIDCFIEIQNRDENELRAYWVFLNEERGMGKYYLDSFNAWVELKGSSQERTSGVANQLGFFLLEASLYTEAELLFIRALQIQEQSFGKNHPEVAIHLTNLASLLQNTNRHSEAEPLILRALHIVEHNFGKDHPKVAIRLNNLARLLQDTNRLDQAEPLMLRALQIQEQSFGKDHPNVAIYLNGLALLLKATNRHSEAEPLMLRALQIDEQSFGKGHPKVATDLTNLATLLQDTNRFGEAESLMLRAFQIDEQCFGKNHPKVATNLNNLATLFYATKRIDEAESLMLRAFQIDEQCFGKDHPKVATDLNNLAQLFKSANRIVEAESLMLRALQVDEQSFGKDHPKIAIRLNNLAQLLQATNRLGEAEPLMRRVIKIVEKSLGENHPDVATSLNNLAALLQDTNRLGEAEPMMLRALQIDEQSFGKDHPSVARDLNNLAQLLYATNRIEEAEPISRRHVEIYLHFTRETGHQHPYLHLAINNHVNLLEELGWSQKQIDAQLRKMGIELSD